MRKTKIILSISLALLFIFGSSFAELSDKKRQESKELEQPAAEKEKDVVPVSQTAIKQESSTHRIASFILITDMIGSFGGQKYNGGCDLSVFAGGQSSAIGSGTSTNFNLYAGFVYPAVVKCGDANGDGKLSVSDVVYLINYLFKGGPGPKPYEAGEVNCDSKISVSDVVYLINYLFKGGPQPVC